LPQPLEHWELRMHLRKAFHFPHMNNQWPRTFIQVPHFLADLKLASATLLLQLHFFSLSGSLTPGLTQGNCPPGMICFLSQPW
jgi:hypothetical protein